MSWVKAGPCDHPPRKYMRADPERNDDGKLIWECLTALANCSNVYAAKCIEEHEGGV